MPSSAKSPSPQTDRDRLPPVARIRAYLELMRVPNLFTAVGDVMMGYLVADQLESDGSIGLATPSIDWQFGLLAAASCLLYTAGMVINDLFDAPFDAANRPERPIPAGRVSLAAARILGWELLLTGIACAWLASFFADRWWPGVVGSALAGSILLYDGWAKRTPLGPLLMGSCRGLNVLLGMSLATTAATGLSLPWIAPHGLIAAGIAVYTIGITLMARNEAMGGHRPFLVMGTAILLGGMAVLVSLPLVARAIVPNVSQWWVLWGVLVVLVGWRCVRAIIDPRPSLVRAAVKHAILSIIFLDAAITAGVCGSNWGIAVLSLVVPAMILGKWFEST